MDEIQNANSTVLSVLEQPDNDTQVQSDDQVFLIMQRHQTREDPAAGYAVAIFYLIMITMVLAQSGLVLWKKKHKRSYELVTLLGLWLVPVIISFHLNFWRFILVWMTFSGVTGWMLRLCTFKKKLSPATPRLIYTWFLATHKVSVGLGVAGYAMLILKMTAWGVLGPELTNYLPGQIAITCIWYALYFGILGRDAAEVAADRMALVMGSGRKLAVSVKDCGICGGEIQGWQQEVSGEGRSGTVQLACKHLFHEKCVRGWTIVGKKDTCPVCLEKVDMRSLYAGRPWESSNLQWIQMLDAVRYMVVWNPIILFALHCVFQASGINRRMQATHEAFEQERAAEQAAFLASIALVEGSLGNLTALSAGNATFGNSTGFAALAR